MSEDRFGGLDPQDPEFDSIEDFVEFLEDDERTEFTHLHMACLNFRLGIPVHKIRLDLEEYGFKLARRAIPRRIRGFSANSHDRWFGPGSSPTHGGSGWENITGFAGQDG